ncbi:UNVERIFIED_CONTAM: hypothetical protein FKN15_030790 [Acipenser sinensis]
MSRSQDDPEPESSGHGQGDDLGLKTAFEESWSKMDHTEAVKFLWGPNYNKCQKNESEEEPHESEEQAESSESVSAECTATTAEGKNESQPLNCQFKARETEETDNAIARSDTACWGPITEEVLEETEAAKKKPSGQRTTLERRRVNRFDVLKIGDAKTLIVPGSASESNPAEIKFYVKTDDLFQILREAHIAIGHGGKHRMEAALSKKAYQDVKEMLSAWTKENQTPHWAEGLRFVQFHKNSTLHQGINQSPYEAMFGKKAKLGLKNSSLPKEITDALETKHELEKTPTQIQIGEEQPPTHCTGSSTPEEIVTVDDYSILEVPEDGQNGFGSSTESHVTEAEGTVCQETSSGAHTCAVFKDVVHAICGETLGGDEGYRSKIICSLCTKKTNLKIQRKRAHSCLAKQAKKMRSGREEVSTGSSWNYSADPNPSYGPWST